ncbi:MAG: hypothetical protein M9916_12560 [Crocinitomicaceae bacterium]|nr:hypothetical protein [Crocinitomicaceae bacterium]
MENEKQIGHKISFWSKVKIVFATLLTVFIILIIIKNWYSVEVNLVFKAYSFPLTIIIALSIVTGYIWGNLAANRKNRKKEKMTNQAN